MIIWGGGGFGVNTGGRYNPTTKRNWIPTTTTNAPEARSSHTALWTGTEMIVWGGYHLNAFNSGGKYNPDTDSWIATNTSNAPSPRASHAAVWTGTEMIIWGGSNYTGTYFDTGKSENGHLDSYYQHECAYGAIPDDGCMDRQRNDGLGWR